MKEKNINERKAKVLTVIATVLLLAIVIGAAYAYFQAQVGNGTNTSINATTGTTDVLTFSMQDLDASNEEKKVTDEEENTTNPEIVINANADNFGEKGNSLADGVTAKANLKANDTTNTASAKYDVYFVIENNELVYTQDNQTPELLLNVKMPNGEEKKELTTIDNLQYYNTNNFSGFDITNKGNIAIPIYKGYEIKVTEGEEVIQEWDIIVTLINLDKDQNKNTGKKLEGKVLLTKELPEGADLKLAHINSLKDTTIGTESIITTLDIDKGTYDIEEYYYGYQEIGTTKTRTIDEEGITWSEPESSETHTFSGLNTNSQYEIYAYTVDSEGFKSNRYETQITVSEGKLPEIEKVEVTEKSYDSISVTVTPKTDESVTITNYEYQIKTNGEVITDKTITDNSTTHEFNNLKELTEYEIVVKAISNEKESVEYKIKEMTRESYYHEVCNEEESGACQIAKTIDTDEKLIYHNLAYATSKNFANANLVANDDSYRYSGASDVVNNYVCLDGTTTKLKCQNDDGSEGDDNLYRIIGLFKNNDNQYEIKLIKAIISTKEQLGDNGAFYDCGGNRWCKPYDVYYWNNSTNTNKWSESNLNTDNLNTNYKAYIEKKIGEGKIVEHRWIIGGNSYNNIVNTENIQTTYTNEIKNPTTTDTITAMVGLMYASDYGYASSSIKWKTKLYDYDELMIDYNWMFIDNTSEWTITNFSNYTNYVFYVSSFKHRDNLVDYRVYDLSYGVRPVFYLTSDTKLASGDGTKEEPFRLKLNEE